MRGPAMHSLVVTAENFRVEHRLSSSWTKTDALVDSVLFIQKLARAGIKPKTAVLSFPGSTVRPVKLTYSLKKILKAENGYRI